jgi:hypothetical protein
MAENAWKNFAKASVTVVLCAAEVSMVQAEVLDDAVEPAPPTDWLVEVGMEDVVVTTGTEDCEWLAAPGVLKMANPVTAATATMTMTAAAMRIFLVPTPDGGGAVLPALGGGGSAPRGSWASALQRFLPLTTSRQSLQTPRPQTAQTATARRSGWL